MPGSSWGHEADPGAARALAAYVHGFTWRELGADTANIGVSLVVGGVFAAATAIGLVASLATTLVVGVGVLVRSLTLQLTARMAAFDRRRLARLGVPVELLAFPVAEAGASFRQQRAAWASARWLWRLPAYQLARLVLAAALAFGALAWWWATVVCFVLAGQPRHPVQLVGWQVAPVRLTVAGTLGLVAAGLVGVLAWPVLARGFVALDATVARAFLETSRSTLAAEVARLSQARTLAVESAEAERRRIERDLHDGLQPQLVSLALELGLARGRMERDPDTARELVGRAHDEAKRAAEDLRNLVRGIHPSVLDERGLDAALSALVARCLVPVSVDVHLHVRPDPTKEAVAYFVVSEALANITKHSGATRAGVRIDGDGEVLRIAVEDDGRGGARFDPGGGLAGLAARVAAVDGTFELDSPTGGPTRLEAVIPCGR